jgi:hypothetical protein
VAGRAAILLFASRPEAFSPVSTISRSPSSGSRDGRRATHISRLPEGGWPRLVDRPEQKLKGLPRGQAGNPHEGRVL